MLKNRDQFEKFQCDTGNKTQKLLRYRSKNLFALSSKKGQIGINTKAKNTAN